MLKAEILKTIKSPKSWVSFVIFFAFAIGDSIYAKINTGFEMGFQNCHPAYMSMLQASTNAMIRLNFWIIPIYVMLLYADKYMNEKKCKISNVYLTKMSKRAYFVKKCASGFLITFCAFAIPIVTNFVVNCITMRGNTGFANLDSYTEEEIGFQIYYGVRHPYSVYICFIFSACIIYGVLCIMCQSIAVLFEDNRIAYLVSFAIWMVFYTDRRFAMCYALQPFIETGYDAALKSFLVFVTLSAVIFSAAFIKISVKKDEI